MSIRILLTGCILLAGSALFSQGVFSTNDVNYTRGYDAYKAKNYSEAVSHFEKFISIEERSNIPEREKKLMNACLYAGYCASNSNKTASIIPNYLKGIKLARKLNNKPTLSLLLNNMGLEYQRIGKFKEAIDAHKESLDLDIELQKIRSIGIDYSNMGDAYLKWGDYARAMEHFEKSSEFHRRDKDWIKVAQRDLGIAEVYLKWNQLDKAIELLKNAIEYLANNGMNTASARVTLAEAYIAKKDLDQAITEIQTALELDTKTKNDDRLASHLSVLGLLYHKKKQYLAAIDTYEEALAYANFYKDKAQKSIILTNIGATFYEQGKTAEAIPKFEEAVSLKEELRLAAFGPIRRDYLSSQINTYKFLANCYMKSGQVAKAFEAVEAGRSKYLAEQMVKTGVEPKTLTAKETQQLLGKDDVLLVYANSDWREKIVIRLTKDKISGMILDDQNFIRDVVNLSKGKSRSETDATRGSLNYVIDKILSKEAVGPVQDTDIFEVAINYYRKFITNRLPEQRLSKMFYSLLIQPIEKEISKNSNLIISPDGLLNYLPYETLQDNNGNYLGAVKNIRYTQSAGVLHLLNQRNYSEDRKYMLAFGGSVYNESSFRSDMKIPEGTYLKGEDFTAPISLGSLPEIRYVNPPDDIFIAQTILSENEQKQKRSIRDTYKKLGITTMNNLPGTLFEIENLSPVVPNIKTFTKYESTEYNLKNLNKSGELANYKVVHLATHGLTIPVLPEISAVVLSIFDNPRGEDGYLRTQEINELDIKADFVNLSACETGLGKIYGGEGVVGLTQSFLIAGANGLSVSLWSVDDASTAIFMVEMYKKVNQKGMDYYQAIAETKKEFISGKYGDSYKKPYFWAPFVYYGRVN